MAETKSAIAGTKIDAGGADFSDRKIWLTAPRGHPRIRINKWRVREGYPVSNSQIILLYELLDSNDKEVKKLKSSRVGVVKKRLYSEGAIIQEGAAILELSDCVHTTVIKDMCADCGADLRHNENGNTSEASVPMVHSIPDLKVTQKLAQKLGHDDTRRLLQDRKLVLLVDLDQTLIHTTNDNVPNNIKGIYHFQLYGPHSPWYHTRLRPGTPNFLEIVSKYYELHICTFGARNYAHMIAQLLDPDGKFFSHRILSRDECFNATSKTDNLRALFPNGDSMVCIIDDREDVWNMASNLIQVKPYHFFQHTGDINAPPGLSKHELDGEGVDFKDIKNIATDKDSKTENDLENKEKSGDSEASDSPSEISETDVSNKTEDTHNEGDEGNEGDELNIEIKNIEDKQEYVDVEDCSIVLDEDIESNGKECKEVPNKSKTANKTVTKDGINTATDTKTSENNKESKDTVAAATSSTAALDSLVENISPKIRVPADPQNQIEIEDPDDYLLYLEVILKLIHNRFYKIFDETQEIADLKIIVPKIRSEVLRGANLVFSGLVPTNMKLEQSRAYFIAKSLGANVSQSFGPDTTHLVAVTSGTYKVNACKKNPKIKIVNPNWLWTCAERWERVDEKLYPLDRKTKSKQRQPPAHCHSPEHVPNYSNKSEISLSSSTQKQNSTEPEKFIDTINPLLSFSNADLADMNKEFDQFFESDSSSEDEHINIENPPVDKILRKRKREEQEEERTRDFFTRSTTNIENMKLTTIDKSSDDEDDNDDDDDAPPSTKFRRGEDLPSDLDMGSGDSNASADNPDTEDDGEWNMMGAALEREFLGLED